MESSRSKSANVFMFNNWNNLSVFFPRNGRIQIFHLAIVHYAVIFWWNSIKLHKFSMITPDLYNSLRELQLTLILILLSITYSPFWIGLLVIVAGWWPYILPLLRGIIKTSWWDQVTKIMIKGRVGSKLAQNCENWLVKDRQQIRLQMQDSLSSSMEDLFNDSFQIKYNTINNSFLILKVVYGT